MAKSTRWVYFFGNGKADGRGDQKELLGGKGAGLAEMTRIGLPVPAGFTITTAGCAAYNNRGQKWPPGLEQEIRQNLLKLERACGKKFGGSKDPLLVSVRSGAARSMPGMMETILNLGLNDQSVEALAKASGNRRFAFDAYRRLIMMYGSTARGVERHLFDAAFESLKRERTARRIGARGDEKIADTDVDAEELEELVVRFKQIYREHSGEEFPQAPFAQLVGAINAVFYSWMAEKAETYRRVENITGLAGTAVNVCQMVFGNMGDDCGTGVAFTRDPSTGENIFYGDYLVNAQGEDVVAGVRTPLRLEELQNLMPEVYEHLEAVRVILEVHYKDMQDIEFTIERRKLYLLQCRVGKRSPQAAFRIAVEQATKPLLAPPVSRRFVKKKLLSAQNAKAALAPIITRDQAIKRISASEVERLFFPVLDPSIPPAELSRRLLGEGIGAVPGAACGEVVFSARDAEARAAQGARVILVRKETSPEDVGGMHAAAGVLTATGGKTSHAAVVARGWGKCCIVGCEALNVDYAQNRMRINGRVLQRGDAIALDGSTGRIFEGLIPLARPEAPKEFQTLLGWCDQRRRMRVRANADTPADAAKAIELGAEGIGLCRTEHMFFEASQPQRIRAVREMILAGDESARVRALEKLLPYQIEDFAGIFKAMAGRPVTIRLIDPPLHEFLPHHDNPQGQREVADEMNAALREELAQVPPWSTQARRAIESKMITVEEIARRVEQLREANPMLGHRGCRLCVTFPEILDMQVRAIIEAAIRCEADGVRVLPEIMIPLSIDARELALLIARTKAVADALIKQHKSKLKYLAGTMIETPRAALTADRLAESAEFFSFGTNDLTQLTMGLSRDDAGRFLPDYLDEHPKLLSLPPYQGGIQGGETSYLHRSPSHGDAINRPPSQGEPQGGEDARSNSSRPLEIGNWQPPFTGPILPYDPFQSLDVEGVGALVQMACEKGRAAQPGIKLGICGEHGGDPQSIEFCERVGLDYVSCSPYRVPVARLAAAQATITAGGSSRPGNKRSTRKNAPRPQRRAFSQTKGREKVTKSKGRQTPMSSKSEGIVARPPKKRNAARSRRRELVNV